MTTMEWIVMGEVGVSSKTIWSVMMGIATEKGQRCQFMYDTPSDPDDFRRCYLLLEMFPDWRARIAEVGEVFPKWKPLVDRWDELEKLWLEESPARRCPKLYELMQELNEQGMILDGWKRTSRYSWERK